MATVTNWIDHLSASEVQGAVYPGVGSEGILVILGFIPGWIIAKVLHGMGKLRIPREVEIAGLDYDMLEASKDDEKAVSSATR